MDRFLIILCLIVVSSCSNDDPVVIIEDGKIRGTSTTNLDGKTVYSFLGIPYAKPPKGELRFKDSLPVEPWNETLDGSKMGNCCFQEGMKGSEDCLNLNVHTKELNPTELKPVMVFIHGGVFISGSNQPFGPDFLLIEDVVLVAINYRLGIFGFLRLENATLGVSGNAGLKDQTLALKWVQKNIKNFGGDPNDVTIFGESAGAASVHYHILSEASRGLFHKAILQSGTVLNPWASVDRQFAMKFAAFLRLEITTEEELLEFMMYNGDRDIYLYQQKYLKGTFLPAFGPVIEDPNDSQFITESGLDILNSGKYNKVPIMMGYCSNEGLIFEAAKRRVFVNDAVLGQESHMQVTFPRVMTVPTNQSIGSHINRELIDIYFKGTNANNKYLLSSDYFFIHGILGSAVLHANSLENPVYLYRMSLDAGRNAAKMLCQLNDFPGACHGDEAGYLFNISGLNMGEQEERYVRTFVKLWTNFAKFGNPTPNGTDLGIEWQPVDENQHFLDIGENLTLLNKPEGERMGVWQEIFPDMHGCQKC